MSQDGKKEHTPPDGGIDRKKARVLEGESRWKRGVLIIGGAALALFGGWMVVQTFLPPHGDARMVQAAGAAGRVPAKEVVSRDGFVALPLADLEDGQVHHYAYRSGNTAVRFFLLKAPDGTVRAALDACTACYRAKRGYSPKGDTMICNNCGMAFRSTDVGIRSGGCNPIPISATAQGDSILIPARDLEEGVKYF